MEKTLKADGMCGIQNLSKSGSSLNISQRRMLTIVKETFFMNLPSMWSDVPRGRHINSKTAAFLSWWKKCSSDKLWYVTSGGLDSSILHSRTMTLLPLYYTLKILKWLYHLRVLKLSMSHVVHYPMQSQDSCMQYCFCLQGKIGGIVYSVHCRGSNQLLDSPLWKQTWLC